MDFLLLASGEFVPDDDNGRTRPGEGTAAEHGLAHVIDQGFFSDERQTEPNHQAHSVANNRDTRRLLATASFHINVL